MNDTEILTALTVCSNDDDGCRQCPYYGLGSSSCLAQNQKDAAELIKRQNAEIERLQKEIIVKNNALLNIVYIAKRMPQTVCDHCYPDFDREGLPVNVWQAREGYAAVDALVEQIVKEASV